MKKNMALPYKTTIVIALLVCGAWASPLFSTDFKTSPRHINAKGLTHVELAAYLNAIDEAQNHNTPNLNLELGVVLDISGSMIGEPLHQSKEAIKGLAKQLRAGDILHLVVYDSDAEVIFEGGQIDQLDTLIQKIDAISTRGSTNMYSGLSLMRDVFTKSRRSETAPLLSQIFLFSDGMVNTGPGAGAIFKLTQKIRSEDNIHVSTFGLGEQFDENLMASVADYGNGDYLYIRTIKDIEKALMLGFQGVKQLKATEMSLQLVNQKEYVENLKLVGAQEKGGVEGTSFLGNYFSDSNKRALISFDVAPPAGHEAREALPLFEILIIYKDLSGEKQSISIPFSMTLSENAEDLSLIPAIQKLFAIQELEAKDKKVLDFVQQGDTERAIELKKEVVKELAMMADIPEGAVAHNRGLDVLDRLISGSLQEQEKAIKAANRANYISRHADKHYNEYG